MSASASNALELLKASNYFSEASESLLVALAEKMIPVSVEDGHVFFEEGDEIHSVIVVEEGVIRRTKLSAEDGEEKDFIKTSIRQRPSSERALQIADSSVVVDIISGRGRVTGLLHNFRAGGEAFATVSAYGPVKAWLIHGDDFRDVVTGSPQHALDVMFALSKELREGNKSLQALIKKSKEQGLGVDTPDGKVLKVLCYDTTSWVSDGFTHALDEFNQIHKEEDGYTITMEYTTERLNEQSATFAAGYEAVCLFVNDTANATVLRTLSLLGVKMIAMRCAGFDRVDTKAARAYGLTVARVPAYSPYAVAEMAVALLMSVIRKIHKASNRVKMANFTLDSGLMGVDIYGKTVGVMGTGKIGAILCNIMLGFGANLICYDVFENDEVKRAGGKYVSQDEIFAKSDILFLMMPLLPPTYHTINFDVLPKLKKGVVLINTSRGGLIDTKALLKGLHDGIISGVGADVYENEQEFFFQDWSARNIPDADLVALMGHNNVVLTAHQAFFTKEAVDKIVDTTLENFHDYYCKGLTGHHHPNNCIPALPKE